MSRSIVILGGLAVSFLAAVVLGVPPPVGAGDVPPMARVEVATRAPDFVLTDQDGRRFSLRHLEGKAALVAFIYTSCPDVCPLIYGVVTSVQQRAKAAGAGELMCVFVSTDPEVDRPEVLKAYLARRGADRSAVVFLTGNPEELRAVWRDFGIKVTRRARGLVDHTPLTVLVDGSGVIRYRYLGGVLESETVLADARAVLKEKAASKKCH